MHNAIVRPAKPFVPGLKPLPPQPDLSAGLCVTHDHREWWTSSCLRADRQQAIKVCRGCPCLAACREWSLCLPATDRAVYAGMTWSERVEAKAEQGRAAKRQDELQAAAERLAARRPECSKGHDLRPGQPNLIMLTNKQGTPIRRCRICVNAYQRVIYQRHIETRHAEQRARRAVPANQEAHKAYARRWYAANSAEILERRRQRASASAAA